MGLLRTVRVAVQAAYRSAAASLRAVQVTAVVGYRPASAPVRTTQVVALVGRRHVASTVTARVAVLVGYQYTGPWPPTSGGTSFSWVRVRWW